MKNSSDTIGNRTRDLPTCSAVPQPTALRRAPYVYISKEIQKCSKYEDSQLAICSYSQHNVGLDSSVGMETRLRAGRPMRRGSILDRANTFFFL